MLCRIVKSRWRDTYDVINATIVYLSFRFVMRICVIKCYKRILL